MSRKHCKRGIRLTSNHYKRTRNPSGIAIVKQQNIALMNYRHPHSGVTLVELLLSLGLVATLLIAAVSGYLTLQKNSRIDNTVNSLVRSIHIARQNSRVGDMPVTLCHTADGQRCNNSPDWDTGWLLFRNTDADEPPVIDPGESLLLVHGSVSPLEIHANRNWFSFRSPGTRSTNGTLIVCDDRGSAHARAIVVSYTGKPRVSDVDASGQPLECTGA